MKRKRNKEGIESVPSIASSTRVRHPFLTAPMKNSCCSIATELLADRAYLWRSFSWRLQERTTTLSLALARFFCGRMSIHDLLYVSWEVNGTLITTTLWRGESCAGLAIKLILQLFHLSWKEIFIEKLLIQRCFFDFTIMIYPLTETERFIMDSLYLFHSGVHIVAFLKSRRV